MKSTKFKFFGFAGVLVMIFSLVLFITNNQTNAASNVPVDVEKMVIKSLPANFQLISREVSPTGVFLHYANNEKPVNFKDIRIEILKPSAQKKSLKKQGQGWWLPAAETKTIHINNIPVELKIQNDGVQPWLELSADLGNKTVNVLSRNFTEQEFITALSSIGVSDVPLRDDKLIHDQMNEINGIIKSAKSLNDVKLLLKPFEQKGWTIKDQALAGYPENELVSIGVSAEEMTITFRSGSGQ